MKDRIFNAFDQIHAEEALIEKTLEGMYSYREKRSRRAFFSQRGMGLAISFAIMLCIGVTGWQTVFTQAFALSVDVNPSIEMTVNRFDKVISAKGINEEGKEVIASVDIKYMNYADAVDCLLEEEKALGYLEEEGTVLVAVACPEKEKAAQVKETIDTAQAETPQTVVVIHPKEAVVEKAQKEDMSFGKYQAYLDIQEVAPEVTTEEVKNMSVQEIASIMSGETTTQTGIAIGNNVSDTEKTPGSSSNDAAPTANTNTSTNSSTNANSSATQNGSTNSSSSNNAVKKPVTTPNNSSNSSDSNDKKPTDNTGKDNASDKAPAGTTENDNTSDKKPSGEGTDNTSDKKPSTESDINTAPPTESVDTPQSQPADNADCTAVTEELVP